MFSADAAESRTSPSFEGGVSNRVRDLSVIFPLRSVIAILVQWVIIFTALTVSCLWPNVPVLMVAVIVIGTRQHALGILMHDAAHFRLFKSRWLNDLVATSLLGLPIGVLFSAYRTFHLAHHRHLGSRSDPEHYITAAGPDWQWPKSKLQGVWVALKDLTGFGSVSVILPLVRMMSPLCVVPRVGVIRRIDPLFRMRSLDWIGMCFSGLVVALIASLLSVEMILVIVGVWLLSLLTVFVAIFRIRGLAEHQCLHPTCEVNASRTVITGFLERLLIAPLNVNFHIEHHLYPSVPWYNLPRLSQHLFRQPEYRQEAATNQSYLIGQKSLLNDLVGGGCG